MNLPNGILIEKKKYAKKRFPLLTKSEKWCILILTYKTDRNKEEGAFEYEIISF